MQDIHDLIKLAKEFEEQTINEDVPDVKGSETMNQILSTLSSLELFKSRKEYLSRLESKHLIKFLGGGSSREAFKFKDQDLALKFAKNQKGLAQNKVESNKDLKSKYIGGAEKHDKDYKWLVCKYAKQITEEQFEKAFSFSFSAFCKAIRHEIDTGKKPDNYDEISSSPFFKDIIRVIKKFNLITADICKIDSYGDVAGDIKLIDAGYSDEVYDEFYQKDNRELSSSDLKKV